MIEEWREGQLWFLWWYEVPWEREWREDLTEEESALVAKWDNERKERP